jgi:hypothetical protein
MMIRIFLCLLIPGWFSNAFSQVDKFQYQPKKIKTGIV